MVNEAKSRNIAAIARGLLQKRRGIPEIVLPDAQDRAPLNFGRAARDVFPRNRFHGPGANLRRLPYDGYEDFIIAGGIEHEFPDYFLRDTPRKRLSIVCFLLRLHEAVSQRAGPGDGERTFLLIHRWRFCRYNGLHSDLPYSISRSALA